MGVHQYKLALLPRGYFGEQMPAMLSEADVDLGQDTNSGWWACHPPTARLLAGVRELLPVDKSWGETEEYVSVGDLNSDLRIWKDDGKVWGITFRFSPATDSWALMQKFLSIAQEEHCLLLEQDTSAVLAPDEAVVRQRLAASRAMQFLHDPAGTLANAARELGDDSNLNTGYEITFNDFQELLSYSPYRQHVAPLIRSWFGYEVVPANDRFMLRDRNGCEVSPRAVYDAIQGNRERQYSIYQTAMSLWR